MLWRKAFSTGKIECDNTMIPMSQEYSVPVQSLPPACTSSNGEMVSQYKHCGSTLVQKQNQFLPPQLQKVTKMLKVALWDMKLER